MPTLLKYLVLFVRMSNLKRISCRLLFGFAFFGFLLTTNPRSVQAGACCASAAAFGVGRLLRWEKFALGVRTNLIQSVGLWNSKAEWSENREGYTDLAWRSEFWGMVGLGKSFSAYARFPWSLNYRKSDMQDSFGGGIGDLQAGVRWDAIRVASQAGIPGIAAMLNLLIPTGRQTDTKLSPLGTEVTGQGTWMLSAAVMIEKAISPWFIQLQLGLNVPFPSYREDLKVNQRLGMGVLAQLANGWEIVPNTLVASVVFRFLWKDALELGGRKINNSHQIDAGIVGALAWRFDPHWTLQMSINSGVFLSQLGANTNGRISYSLGLRYGFF